MLLYGVRRALELSYRWRRLQNVQDECGIVAVVRGIDREVRRIWRPHRNTPLCESQHVEFGDLDVVRVSEVHQVVQRGRCKVRQQELLEVRRSVDATVVTLAAVEFRVDEL